LLEVDSKRRITARELIKEPWVRCSDLPLTIFENLGSYAGGSFTGNRGSSLDNRMSIDKENMSGYHN
jgi:hypothetical protein